MADDPVEIARRCYRAFAESDRGAAETLFGQDFAFTSPLDNRLDRETFFERCWPKNERIDDFHFVRLVPSGEQVVATYEALTVDGKRVRNTEVLTIRGGRIVEVEVYFGWTLPHEAQPGGSVPPA